MAHTTSTDADRAARRAADRERLEQAARALLSSDGWQRWMRVRATNGLARYSFVLLGRRCHRRVLQVGGVDDMSSTMRPAGERRRFGAFGRGWSERWSVSG